MLYHHLINGRVFILTSTTSAMTSHIFKCTFLFVFLFVYALQDCVKALFYANFPKFGWKVEWSGLFCATMYSPGGCSSLTMMLNHLRSDVVSFATFVICIVFKSNLMDSAGFHVARKIIAAVQIHRMPLQSSTIAHKLSVSWLQQRQQVINWSSMSVPSRTVGLSLLFGHPCGHGWHSRPFQTPRSEVTERNSIELCHMLGTEPDLKTDVKNLGHDLKRGAQSRLFSGGFTIVSRFEREYLRNERRRKQTQRKLNHEGPLTFRHNLMNSRPHSRQI